MASTKRTTVGLRDTLFDELDKLRSGDSTPQRASATARIASGIIQSARLEIDFQQRVQANGGKRVSGPAPVLLGKAA